MKFKKTAIAAVVAGFAAAPMMASADTVLSGVVQVKFQGTDAEDDDATPDVDEGEGADANIAAGDVRVAIATEHELNSGLIGYGNVQFNLDDLTGEGGFAENVVQLDTVDPDGSLTDDDIVELTSPATVASDNVYVGVKGGFGDVRLGEIPLAIEYGQLANDIHDVGTTVPGGLSYTGTFGGFGVGLNFSPEDDSDMIGLGAKFNIAGFTIGAGFEDRAEGANIAVGASYAIAGFSLAAHYWAQETDFDPELDIQTDDPDGDDVETTGFDIDDTTAFAVQAGYSISAVSLGLTYSVLDVDDGRDGDQAVIRFDAGYDLGGGTELSTRIQNTTDEDDGDDSDDLVEWRVMLSKTF